MISLFATEQPPRLRLYLLRSHGKFLPNDDGGGNHGGADADADVAVWSRMPEDLVLRRVLQFVPAAKLFQWQSVSRKWRQVLTSADFHKQFMAQAAGAPSEQQRVLAFVNPTGAVFTGWSVPRSIYSLHDMSSTLQAMDVDLSFVPSWFWWSSSYCVEAAGDGLVCVTNSGSGGKRSDNDRVLRCVINPLTRTYRMLPNDWLPSPLAPHLESAGRLVPGLVQLQAGSITVLFRDSVFSDTAWDWAVATCDLTTAAAAPDWAAAYGSVRLQRPDDTTSISNPFDNHFAMCNGETFCYSYCTRRVHVHAACPEAGGLGGLVEVAQLQVEHGKMRASLVAHRGSVFVVGMGNDTPDVWVIWRLERSRMAWEVVARLDRPLLHRLTRGLVCPESKVQTMYGACGAGDLLCFGLTPVTPPARWPVCVVVGFNLETGAWELVHDQQGCMGAWAFQLRPDLFLV